MFSVIVVILLINNQFNIFTESQQLTVNEPVKDVDAQNFSYNLLLVIWFCLLSLCGLCF